MILYLILNVIILALAENFLPKDENAWLTRLILFVAGTPMLVYGMIRNLFKK